MLILIREPFVNSSKGGFVIYNPDCVIRAETTREGAFIISLPPSLDENNDIHLTNPTARSAIAWWFTEADVEFYHVNHPFKTIDVVKEWRDRDQGEGGLP